MPVVSLCGGSGTAAVCTGSRQPFTGLAASLDAQGYSVSDIIHILMRKEVRHERTFTGTGSSQHREQAAWRAVAETEKRRHQGNTWLNIRMRGRFSAV